MFLHGRFSQIIRSLADILHAPVLSMSMRSTDWKTVQRFFTVGVCGVPVSVCVSESLSEERITDPETPESQLMHLN